jgi:hypothetical protein
VPGGRITAADVGVRQLIHQQQSRPTRQGCVEIEFAARAVTDSDAQRGQLFQSGQKIFGVAASMQLDVADDHVDPLRAAALGSLEHRVGFAHTGIGAKENGQAAAMSARLGFTHARKQQVRIRPACVHRRQSSLVNAARQARD